MARKPLDFANMAALGISVATSWQSRHPNYTVKFTTATALLTTSVLFRDKATLNQAQDGLKKDNTVALKTINIEVRDAVKILRRYIQGEYPTIKDWSAHFAAYGLEAIAQRTYGLPSDNDRRIQRLNILVNKLQESNNPFALRDFGLVYWQNLLTRLENEWTLSKTLKGDKTTLSSETVAYMTEVSETLQKLYASIRIDFPKANIAKTFREFGFLNEVF